jgi:3-phenylpropionate/cinnamic acid dioxygenase small subunit
MATTIDGPPVVPDAELSLHLNNVALREQLSAMLAYEAWLLDNDRFEDWLGMLAADIRYVAPVRRKITDENLDVQTIDSAPSIVSHFNDQLPQLALRVKRLRTGFNHYDRPAALVRRMVGPVVLLDWQDSSQEAIISSGFFLFRAREEKEETLFCGARDDIWRRSSDGTWRLARRLIKLDHHIVPPLSVFF